MQINWFTVIAQVLNFFLLVWLLKRFLYKPILNAITEREEKIVAQLADAKTTKAEALKEQDEFKQKNTAFEEEKKTRMDKVITETKEASEKLMETARTEAESMKEELEKAAKEKQENSKKVMAQLLQEEVFAVSRLALSDLASVQLEEQATAIFIQRITALKEVELEQFKKAFTNNSIVLRSAFLLTEAQQGTIEKAVDTVLETKATYSYKLTPEIIGGIELSTNEYKLAWSISAYLTSLEEKSRDPTNEKTEAPVA